MNSTTRSERLTLVLGGTGKVAAMVAALLYSLGLMRNGGT